MLHPLDRVTPESLRRLHRESVAGRAAVRRLLERLRQAGTPLGSGINRRNDPRTATVERLEPDRVRLRIRDFDHAAGAQLFLNFELDGTRYFVARGPRRLPPRGHAAGHRSTWLSRFGKRRARFRARSGKSGPSARTTLS